MVEEQEEKDRRENKREKRGRRDGKGRYRSLLTSVRLPRTMTAACGRKGGREEKGREERAGRVQLSLSPCILDL